MPNRKPKEQPRRAVPAILLRRILLAPRMHGPPLPPPPCHPHPSPRARLPLAHGCNGGWGYPRSHHASPSSLLPSARYLPHACARSPTLGAVVVVSAQGAARGARRQHLLGRWWFPHVGVAAVQRCVPKRVVRGLVGGVGERGRVVPRVGRVGRQGCSARGFQKHPTLVLEALDKVHLPADLALALHPVSTRLGFFYRGEVPAGCEGGLHGGFQWLQTVNRRLLSWDDDLSSFGTKRHLQKRLKAGLGRQDSMQPICSHYGLPKNVLWTKI